MFKKQQLFKKRDVKIWIFKCHSYVLCAFCLMFQSILGSQRHLPLFD